MSDPYDPETLRLPKGLPTTLPSPLTPRRHRAGEKFLKGPIPLAGRAGGDPVWPGTWHQKAAEMIRIDLAAAGVPFAVPGPDGRPLAADFHALRHTCGVLAERGGATVREVMALMRHADPKLTLKTYGRLRPHDLAAAVGKIPTVLPQAG